MEDAFGNRQRAEAYRDAVSRASEGIGALCWNQKYGLLADTPAQKHFSQHANLLGVWLDVVPHAQQKTVLMKVLSRSDMGFKADGPLPQMSQATYYFRFYLARALEHADMGNEYVRLLQPWQADVYVPQVSVFQRDRKSTRLNSSH